LTSPPRDDEARRADTAARFAAGIAELRAALAALGDEHLEAVHALAADVLRSWRQGGKFLICGNGGSAADSQHIAAELVGRYLAERPGYAAIALTTNTSTLTAVANDYGYEAVFARQVEALGRAEDVLLVISTSGNSPNCLAAVAAARRVGMRVHGFLGKRGGELAGAVDGALVAPSDATPRIQEIHIAMGHLLCELLERWRTDENDERHGAD
jgi:D-sedoheptulose 7-phosphate isomerase